jgi:hypothetical protein
MDLHAILHNHRTGERSVEVHLPAYKPSVSDIENLSAFYVDGCRL